MLNPEVGGTLTDRLPETGKLSEEEAFECFLDWTLEQGFELYPAQEEAILEVMTGRHVILNTPTGSGKSLVAVAMHFHALAQGERSVYTSPVKALVSEKFFALCELFGPEQVGMLTGDASINRDAPVLCCTAEVLANQALRDGSDADVDAVVMDEFHYYADRDRGMAWQIPLLILGQARFLLMSATLGDMARVESGLVALTNREVSLVSSDERPVPLTFEYREIPIHHTLSELVRLNRAPVYVVNFSQREAAEQAQAQMSVDVCTKEEKRAIVEALRGVRFDSPYGPVVKRYLLHGIGLHHAGLLPRYRLLVERLSQAGLLKIINGTDTLGVGVNIPIRTVLFTKLCKFDGEQVRILSVRDFKQISGRAGRKGYDDQGWVLCQAPEHVIENRRLETRAMQQGRKKYKKKKPPQRGYVPWSQATFEKLVAGKPEPLESVFRVEQGMLLNLLHRGDDLALRGGGYRLLTELIEMSHERSGRKSRLRRSAAQMFKALVAAQIVEFQPREGEAGRDAMINRDLQRSFSLHHVLSLYVVDAIGCLEPQDPEYALNLLTIVESILENPRVVLARQVAARKTELVAQLKAEGVPYEERMEKLEEITWPRPRKEWIWETFERFTSRHPWVSTESIRPKSIGRDLYERYCSFDDYVREYDLERAEGVLLRYLTQLYKALVQNVPEADQTEEVLDVIGMLRMVLMRVDDSLVREWERLQSIERDGLEEDSASVRPPPSLEEDPRAFNARIRAELHALVRALSVRDYDAAVRCVAESPDDPWTDERFENALEEYWSQYDALLFNHRARLADKTIRTEAGPRRWEVTQVLCDPDEDDTWCLELVIELEGRPKDSPKPLLRLIRVGL